MLRFNWGRSRSAHLYCARKFTRHVIHPVPSSTCYRADGHCYSFTWIQRPWTFGGPYFLFMDHFLDNFPCLKKIKKIYRSEVWIFLQNASSNSVLFSSSFISAAVSNSSWRVEFFENVGNIWKFFFLQKTHFYKIWLRSFASVDLPSLFWTIHPL